MKKKISLLLVILMLVTLMPMSMAASEEKAVKSAQKFELDGEEIKLPAYSIKGKNYLKLRDLAAIMSGKEAKFNVYYAEHDGVLSIQTKKEYQKQKGDLEEIKDINAKAILSEKDIALNLDDKKLKTALINGNNYVELRDLANLIGFGIDYNGKTKTVLLNSSLSDPKKSKEWLGLPDAAKEALNEHENKISDTIEKLKDVDIFNVDDIKDEELRKTAYTKIEDGLGGLPTYVEGAKIEYSGGDIDCKIRHVYSGGAVLYDRFLQEGDKFKWWYGGGSNKSFITTFSFDDMNNFNKGAKDFKITGYNYKGAEYTASKLKDFHDAIARNKYTKAMEDLEEAGFTSKMGIYMNTSEENVRDFVKIKKKEGYMHGLEIFLEDYEFSKDCNDYDIYLTFKYKNGGELKFIIDRRIHCFGMMIIDGKNK